MRKLVMKKWAVLMVWNFVSIPALASLSSECIQTLQHPNPSTVQACSHIDNKFALRCVQSLPERSADQIQACSLIQNEYALRCVRGLKKPTADDIEVCLVADVQAEGNIPEICSVPEKPLAPDAAVPALGSSAGARADSAI
jgi:hypothetical protein